MKRLFVLAAMCGVLLAADEPKDVGDQDRKALQGTWQVVEQTHGDDAVDEQAKGVQFIFDHNKIVVKKDEKAILEGTFRIDAAKSPPQIDAKILKDEEEPQRVGETAVGIYQISGDRLKWCSSEPGQDTRPSEFATKGTNFVLIVLERSKK
jgi:uncharacterized protein (TIGR03067 family)